MKTLIALILLLPGAAEVTTGIPGVSDADYTELRALVLPYTYEIDKPVTVYNWHEAKGESDLTRNSKGPKEYAALQSFAGRYWDLQTVPSNATAQYGTGLYVAVDPVVSRSYGGGDVGKNNWVLTQIHLRAGFRTLDVKRDGGVVPTLDHGDLATRLGCPEDWQTQGLLDALVTPAKYSGYPTCAAVVRKLLKDDLKIDGFAYGFGSTDFADCYHPVESKTTPSGSIQQQVAFVITNPDRLSPADVSVFSRLTTDDSESRARVQALFVKSKMENGAVSAEFKGPSQAQLKAQLKSQGIDDYSSWLQNQADSGTVAVNGVNSWYGTYCDKPGYSAAGDSSHPLPPAPGLRAVAMRCVTIAMASPTYAGTSMPVPPKDPKATPPDTPSFLSASSGAEFLWSDLEGAAFPADMHGWMQRNLYGCEKPIGYKRVKDIPVHPSASDGEPTNGASFQDAR